MAAFSADAALLGRIFSMLPGMVAYWDNQQRCRFANADYERWFGVKPDDLIGKTLEELLGPIYPLNLPHILGALRGEAQMFERDIPDPVGGPVRHSQAHYIPDVVDGVVQGFVVLVTDISLNRKLVNELRAAQERASSMATHDFLTGLPNRVLIEDRLRVALEDSERRQAKFGVLFLDLDDFKTINDRFGHGSGDTVLREVAKRLVETLRTVDTAARLGGDEFLVLLPNIGQRDQACIVARKLLAAMGQRSFGTDEPPLTLTVSIGIALYPDDGADIHTLLGRADSALYCAKRSGKNQFAFPPTLASSETASPTGHCEA